MMTQCVKWCTPCEMMIQGLCRAMGRGGGRGARPAGSGECGAWWSSWKFVVDETGVEGQLGQEKAQRGVCAA